MTLLPECSQLRSLEKVTWLCILSFTSPNGPTPTRLVPPHSFLSSQRSFSTPSWTLCLLSLFPLHPSVWLSRESLILSALRISTLFQRGMPASFQRQVLASPPLPTHTHTHAYKAWFSTLARPQTHWAFSSEKAGGHT